MPHPPANSWQRRPPARMSRPELRSLGVPLQPRPATEGDIDEMPGFLLLHIGQRCGNTVQHPLDVHVNHLVPIFDLGTVERRLGHQPGVVDHDINPPIGVNGLVNQVLHLLGTGDIGCNASALPPADLPLPLLDNSSAKV
jgi:hypothetical protein